MLFQIDCKKKEYDLDDMTQKMFDLPASWVLVAQMPFGGIEKPADAKPAKDISKRVIIEK